ncbi:hypothetical protein [Pseudarthrobacter albicanus]|uniref:hypothetical protein n=1 Tax=Pseudarthrobacter albicanus TaxID=2823873 RepID=UPI001BA88FE4|nr:hypothetical protein [Pseudarthrobacter albicanus]
MVSGVVWIGTGLMSVVALALGLVLLTPGHRVHGHLCENFQTELLAFAVPLKRRLESCSS